MKRKVFLGCLLFIWMGLMTACGKAPMQESTPPVAEPPAAQNPSGNEAPANPNETVTAETITAYFTDPSLTEVRNHEVTISYKDDAQKYEQAFLSLTQSPEAGYEPLWVSGQWNGAELEDGVIKINLSKVQDQQLGSTGEKFAIEALTQTFFEFDEIRSIQLLVEGQVAETLMGHVDISKPFNRPASS
jgi:spore germination protein GerM